MAVGNGYSSAQILAMQKDAIRRVNEMQRAAREKLRQTQGTLDEAPPAAPSHSHTVPQPVEVRHVEEPGLPREAHRGGNASEPPPPPAGGDAREPFAQAGVEALAVSGPPGPENPLQGILSRLNLDGETVLLLLMLLLLVNEGADSKLIMALVYILL